MQGVHPYERPNVVTLTAVGWTNVQVSRPSLVLPVTALTGYLMAYPGIKTLGPAAVASSNLAKGLDTVQMPGGYSCFLPSEGEWSIYNSGNDRPAVMIVDALHPIAATLLNCGDGAFAVTNHTEAALTDVSGTVLAANPFANYRLFINDSAAPAYLAIDGSAAVVNTGIRVNANGGSYEMSKKAGNMFKGIVRGVMATGLTANVLVTEGGIPVPT